VQYARLVQGSSCQMSSQSLRAFCLAVIQRAVEVRVGRSRSGVVFDVALIAIIWSCSRGQKEVLPSIQHIASIVSGCMNRIDAVESQITLQAVALLWQSVIWQ
jgi:hypothetical protein